MANAAATRNTVFQTATPAGYDFNATNVVPPSELLMEAVALHQMGALDKAEEIYRSLLKNNPDDHDALHYLGLIALQGGCYADAISLIEAAIKVNCRVPAFHCNLGNAYKGAGQLDSAIAAFHEAVRIDPGFLAAHISLGNTLQDHGMLEEAVASYRQALTLKPDYAEAHNNLGITFQVQGKLDKATRYLRKALALKPDFAEAYYNLGNVLKEQGGLDEAMDCYRHAILLKPDYADAHNNLANAFQSQGKLDAAIEHYHRVLGLKPDYAEAYNNLGNVLRDQGRLDEAVESYRKAHLLKPDLAEALSNLLYLHAFTRDISPESECELAAQWESAVLNESERTAARNRALSFSYVPRAGRKLRLGIVSAELGSHAVAQFLEPFMQQMDRARFHVTLYQTAIQPGSGIDRFRNLADEYKSLVGIPDNKASDLIRSDRIDVLIDTTGHMKGCRLGIFAHRAAPVQCHYIGYHGTTGLSEMDWFIADETLLPSSCDAHFREKIWRLPRLWIAYRGDTSLPGSNWKPDAGGTIWLGSFNNLAKVRDETLGLWAKVMNALPEAKLLLKDNKSADPSVQKRIRTELGRHGVSGERVEFAGWVSGWDSHMALYDRLDIALDTIPLNSGTTAFDALWMGVPLVALEGDWMGGRMTNDILKALGKPEWVAQSEDAYVAIVTALARDVEGRKELRATQRTLMAGSQLCDAKGLANSLGEAFEAMFDRWVDKKSGS